MSQNLVVKTYAYQKLSRKNLREVDLIPLPWYKKGYYYYHTFSEVYSNLMRCIVGYHGFNCLFMYVSSPKYGIFRHWCEVNTLEMKNLHTHFNPQNFQRNLKILTFDFSGLQIYLLPGKVPFATVPNKRSAR